MAVFLQVAEFFCPPAKSKSPPSTYPVLSPEPVRTSQPVAPLLYPMHLLSLENLMELTTLLPHQDLKDAGKLGMFDSELSGRVLFISHQWLGYKHADPAGEQLTALQRLLTRLMRGLIPSVEAYWVQQVHFGEVNAVGATEWKAALPHMYFWLDYAGIPGSLSGRRTTR